MLSKTVEPSELGKALSGIAIVAAIMPFILAPAFRGLYKVSTHWSTYLKSVTVF
jgi:hypothetical protein